MDQDKECYSSYTYCLNKNSTEAIDLYQTFIKTREKKSKNGFNKSQTLNRIIKEWAEDRTLMIEVMRKEKK